MPLTISVKEIEAARATVELDGSLDSNTSSLLEERLSLLMKQNPMAIVFDLGKLAYISSAGIRVLVKTKKAMNAAGGTLALTNLQPQIRKVLDIIQALPSLHVFESVEELDRYLDKMQRRVREGGGNAPG